MTRIFFGSIMVLLWVTATFAKDSCPKIHFVNGTVQCTNSTNVGSSCSFQCSKGYQLTGSKQLTCILQKNYTTSWSSTIPHCKKNPRNDLATLLIFFGICAALLVLGGFVYLLFYLVRRFMRNCHQCCAFYQCRACCCCCRGNQNDDENLISDKETGEDNTSSSKLESVNEDNKKKDAESSTPSKKKPSKRMKVFISANKSKRHSSTTSNPKAETVDVIDKESPSTSTGIGKKKFRVVAASTRWPKAEKQPDKVATTHDKESESNTLLSDSSTIVQEDSAAVLTPDVESQQENVNIHLHPTSDNLDNEHSE